MSYSATMQSPDPAARFVECELCAASGPSIGNQSIGDDDAKVFATRRWNNRAAIDNSVEKGAADYWFSEANRDHNEYEKALRAAEATLAEAVDALQAANAAIQEYYRYWTWTDGEARGSYDGKSERNGLWSARNRIKVTLAKI
jgi:hypothetical protein